MKLVQCTECDGVKRFVEFGTGKHFCEECDAELAQPQPAQAEESSLGELAKCPFCGGHNGYVERMEICVYRYLCDCGVQGPPVEKLEYEDHEGNPEADAIKAWNKRA